MITFLFSLFLSASIANADSKTDQLKAEFDSLKTYVQNLEPDGVVGGIMYFKDFGDHEILWDKEGYESKGHETIRIYVPEKLPVQREFAVTYIMSDHLLQDTVTLRRFVGPEVRGWRADTSDLKKGEYQGWQGTQVLRILPNEKALLETYDIELF